MSAGHYIECRTQLRPVVPFSTHGDALFSYSQGLIEDAVFHVRRCDLADGGGLSTLMSYFPEALEGFPGVLPTINVVSTCQTNLGQLLQSDALHLSIAFLFVDINCLLGKLLSLTGLSKRLFCLRQQEQRTALPIAAAALVDGQHLIGCAQSVARFLGCKASTHHHLPSSCLSLLVFAFFEQSYCLSRNLQGFLFLVPCKAHLSTRSQCSCLR
mmetsp:Transcript_32441/g.39903  ORF Transcript_32441/g.39903 Transcript_32441/m.39903 type:complete len:213 (-) Transcript_32441:50-688(-)